MSSHKVHNTYIHTQETNSLGKKAITGVPDKFHSCANTLGLERGPRPDSPQDNASLGKSVVYATEPAARPLVQDKSTEPVDVIILDDNPVSIASYIEEYGDVFK